MNEYQQALVRILELEDRNAELLGALRGINSILAIWVLDPSKAPNTLVTSIQFITEPAIRKGELTCATYSR